MKWNLIFKNFKKCRGIRSGRWSGRVDVRVVEVEERGSESRKPAAKATSWVGFQISDTIQNEKRLVFNFPFSPSLVRARTDRLLIPEKYRSSPDGKTIKIIKPEPEPKPKPEMTFKTQKEPKKRSHEFLDYRTLEISMMIFHKNL